MFNKLISYPCQYLTLFFIFLLTGTLITCGTKNDHQNEPIDIETSSGTVIEENTTKPDESIDTGSLSGTVIDKHTKKPIENALVYLGVYGWKLKYTDNEGKYRIRNFPWGSYGFNVFKPGYKRFKDNFDSKKGEYLVINVELERKPQPPESISIQGIVIRTVTAEGTRSENTFFTIKDDKGKEYYIFNNFGANWGFEDWVDKKVRIMGFKEIGFIGWKWKETEGIYVEKIQGIK